MDQPKYSTVELDSMNNNSVKLYVSGVPSMNDFSEYDFVKDVRKWEKYPNVKLSINIHPSTGGFTWTGNSEDVLAHAKNITEIINNNKLTNVFGITFDFEIPIYDGQITIPIPNLLEYNEALDNWNTFFDWVDIYAPKLEIISVCSLTLSRDISDGDYDLHFLSIAISFNVPRFNKYLTMIYRSHPVATDTTYEFYMKVKDYLTTMNRFFGDPNKAEVLIGISGITDYNKNNEIYESDEHIGNGFEVFAKDVLILKSFGIKQVTFFSSDTFMENDQLLLSVFDAYGDHFFNDMENYVNTNPFDFTVNVGQLANVLVNLELAGSPGLDIIASWWTIPIVILLVIWVRKSSNSSKRRSKSKRRRK